MNNIPHIVDSGASVMKDKPVAWMNIHGQFNKKETWLFPIPLYTHPVKELTDEEIEKVFVLNCNLINETFAYRDFARAILRKAQEK